MKFKKRKIAGGWVKVDVQGDTFYSPFVPEKKEFVLLPTDLDKMKHLESDGSMFEFHNIGWKYLKQKSEEIELPGGIYKFISGDYDSKGPRLVPIELQKEEYYNVNKLEKEILQDFRSFLDDEKIYRDLNITYKRGFLLYGEPGNGKSALIRNLVQNEVPKDAVVIYIKSIPNTSFINAIKKTLPDRLKVFIFEEFVSAIKNNYVEDVLEFLDGHNTIDKSVTFATTNYPEEIPGNLVDRPSRMDVLYEVSNPDDETRIKYMTKLLKREPTELEISKTKNMSFAKVKEIILLNKRLNISIIDSIKNFENRKKLVSKSFAKSQKIGFGLSDD